MDRNETSTATVIFNGEKANATLKQLEAETRKLNVELRQLNVNSKEFGEKKREFQVLFYVRPMTLSEHDRDLRILERYGKDEQNNFYFCSRIIFVYFCFQFLNIQIK